MVVGLSNHQVLPRFIVSINVYFSFSYTSLKHALSVFVLAKSELQGETLSTTFNMLPPGGRSVPQSSGPKHKE